MMIAALVALAAGAVAGIFLATRHFLRKRLPASVALLHGLGGATGFTLVLLTVVREPTFRPIRDVLYLLIATVALGVVNLLFHIRRVRHRTSLILLHGMTAVTSAAMLIRAILVYAPVEPASVLPQPSAPAPAVVAAAPPPDAVQAVGPEDLPEDPPDDPPPTKTPGKFAVDGALRKALERTINFETNSATVSPSSRGEIAELVAVLKSHPEIALLQVQGHADERGDDARNVELTRARAAAVVDALVTRGIARERLHSAGYGARCPSDPACQHDAAAACHDSAAWQRDRRVVLFVLQIDDRPFRGELVCTRAADLIPPQDRPFFALDAEP